MKQIQWYPGHMAKTKRQIKEKVTLIDVVIELVDARIPFSSMNPVLRDMIGNTKKLIVMNKADLANQEELKKWQTHFEKKGVPSIFVNAQTGKGMNQLLPVLKDMLKAEREKALAKGKILRPIRAMVLGIPNVGKSTFINQLANKKKLVTGDRPGVTKQTQYIRIEKDLEILDTPGILWPKFTDEDVAFKLALIGAIKDNILPIDDVVIYGLRFLAKHHLNALNNKYDVDIDIEDIVGTLDQIGKARGCIKRGNQIDYDRVYNLFLNDFRHEGFGKIILDKVEDQDVSV
jgi:ribosome biogenesis GTPase A